MPGGGHLSAAKCRGIQLLLCKVFLSCSANHTHPYASLPQLDGRCTWKAMARGCFPWGNVIYFRYQEGGCMTLVFPIPMLQHRCFWFGSLTVIPVLENSPRTACLCVSSFPCMHLYLRKQFWPCVFCPRSLQSPLWTGNGKAIIL